MTRLRTHNRRRRARELKQGGVYTLQFRPLGPTWGERGASPIVIFDEIRNLWLGLS